ncbi:hypothetical protein [Ruegeria sp.]|uniref:hypothetical protein n=1 Tax=Ruegeria sp. TaxID=1879320 RepID=UPI00230F0005|nr:hypothetical protein [Ruegeria sp.]MDA7965840.1 hypothetical protein [Ruegeria sp.]
MKVEGMSAREGFFCAAYELRDAVDLDEFTYNRLEDLLDWFRQNLDVPTRFNRTSSKGAFRRDTKGLSWFKPDAKATLDRAFELKALLEDHGHPIEILRTVRIGYITYEDDNQVIAEPFSDTPC